MGILSKCFGDSSSSTSRKQPSATVEDLCHRFSLEQLRRSTDSFDKSRLIARNPHGREYRASISVNGELKHVIVERLRQESAIYPKTLIYYKNNIILWCQLQHPNLVSLVGFCDDHNEMIVVSDFDYAPNGSLLDQPYGTERNSPTLSWKRRLEISIGVARGLHYLHSGTKRTIIRCDVRPRSILLDKNWVPKLRFSRLSVKGPKFSDKEAKPIELRSPSGDASYLAPEHLRNAEVTHKVDVYSFGVLLLELICGEHPFNIWRLHQVCNIKELRNLAGTRHGEGIIDESLVGEIAPQCRELYMEITEYCLSEDPNERPDMGEVEVQLEHVLQLQEEADTNRASQASLVT